MRRLWLLGLVAMLLTTACRLEMNLLIDLAEDGSGSFGIEIGTDQEFRDLMDAEGEDSLGFDDLTEAFGIDTPGGSVTKRTDGDMEFTVAKFSFSDATQLQQLLALDSQDEIGDIDITYDGTTVTIDATLEGTGAAGLGGGSEEDMDLEMLGEILSESFFSGGVIVSMPGEVQSHNADRVLPDGRLHWDLRLDGGNIEVNAVSDFSSGGTSFPIWALVLLLAAALAVIVWLVTRSRQKTASVSAVTTSGSTETPTPTTAQNFSETENDNEIEATDDPSKDTEGG